MVKLCQLLLGLRARHMMRSQQQTQQARIYESVFHQVHVRANLYFYRSHLRVFGYLGRHEDHRGIAHTEFVCLHNSNLYKVQLGCKLAGSACVHRYGC